MVNATLVLTETAAILSNRGRTQTYSIDRLETGENTRRVLDISEQYAATGARGAYYLLQTYNDGTFKLLPMAMGRNIVYGRIEGVQ